MTKKTEVFYMQTIGKGFDLVKGAWIADEGIKVYQLTTEEFKEGSVITRDKLKVLKEYINNLRNKDSITTK